MILSLSKVGIKMIKWSALMCAVSSIFSISVSSRMEFQTAFITASPFAIPLIEFMILKEWISTEIITPGSAYLCNCSLNFT